MKRATLTSRWGWSLVAGIIGLGLAGCNKHTTQPTVPPFQLGLDLHPLGNNPPEGTLGDNVYLAGRLTDQYGQAQRGAKVYFTVDPPNNGQVTAFAYTEPDSASGFKEPSRVVFVGSVLGTVVIRGYTLDNGGNEAASDTLHILVQPRNG